MPFQNLNPNYFAQYPQYQQMMQNPYLQRMENLQQFQQTLQPQTQIPALGKVVDSPPSANYRLQEHTETTLLGWSLFLKIFPENA